MPTVEFSLHPVYAQAKPILDKHDEDFRYILNRGWERWTHLSPADRKTFLAAEGTVGKVIAAFMKEAATERFDGRREEGILPRDKYDPPGWSFSNRVLVRFKKMDKNGYSVNFRTKRMRKYLGNLPIPEEDLREAIRIEVGYVLNELETAVDEQFVVHRRSDRILWKYSLKDTGTLILPLRPSTPTDEDREERSLVRPRRATGPKTEPKFPRLLRMTSEDHERRRESAAQLRGKNDTGGA